MQIVDRKKLIGDTPKAFGNYIELVSIKKLSEDTNVEIFEITVPQAATKEKLTIQWKAKAIGVKGSWTTNGLLDKRFRTDWETVRLKSTISVDAPVINLYGYSDENIITIGCSDLINLIHIEASLREEDNHFYFKFHFFNENGFDSDYKAKLYIDKRQDNFGQVLQRWTEWALNENDLKTRLTPPLAKVPLYSTWYSFHQAMDTEDLLKECTLSKKMGYDLVVIDDGWQTLDDDRGYDYTGDWQPERFLDMKLFAQQVHDLGMGIMLWYSVPFCGVKSEAYKRFKGKFLTENHPWAPVFDPRFPEVRNYLVGLYSNALLDWDIDGFKLDFIDDFKLYPETEIEELNGRDTISIAQGCKMLIEEIAAALLEIKPDVLVEFRQQYISPALRQLGNMFRAFDCPSDSLMNRVRTTDVKFLCGESAVHADMLTWHKEESVEVAALQFSSIIFSVPQLSVRLAERSEKELAMINFYTKYWNENKDVLLDGEFSAFKPLLNYPYLSAMNEHTIIYGIYDDIVLPIELEKNTIHIINGKMSSDIVLQIYGPESTWNRQIFNCMGEIQLQDKLTLNASLLNMKCPANGIIFLTKET